MNKQTDKENNYLLETLLQGEPPENNIINQLSVGVNFITDFWRQEYFKDYIKEGGSKIKFITGQPGSGKSHLLKLMSSIAKEENYVTVSFSAKDIWLNDFKEIYKEIIKRCDFSALLNKICNNVIRELGFNPEEISVGQNFINYLSETGNNDPLTRRSIIIYLNNIFLNNPLMDNNFAYVCSLLCGGILGHPLLEKYNEQMLLSWIHCDNTVKLSSLRKLGFFPSRISKYNARHMLRSLTEIIKLAGYSGLFVCIDNLDEILNKSSISLLHYTKMKREDSYESIRQLIDEIDTFRNIMFVFSFERKLIDNDGKGLKSYQALWMRIQNEVVGKRLNKFTDFLDLDKLAVQIYTPKVLVEMSRKLASIIDYMDVETKVIDEDTARKLIDKAKISNISIPRLVNYATLKSKVINNSETVERLILLPTNIEGETDNV